VALVALVAVAGAAPLTAVAQVVLMVVVPERYDSEEQVVLILVVVEAVAADQVNLAVLGQAPQADPV
jgi:hypothetical protein